MNYIPRPKLVSSHCTLLYAHIYWAYCDQAQSDWCVLSWQESAFRWHESLPITSVNPNIFCCTYAFTHGVVSTYRNLCVPQGRFINLSPPPPPPPPPTHTHTHLLDKMAAISQMIFSDAFLQIKYLYCDKKKLMKQSLFLRVQLTIIQYLSRCRIFGVKPLSGPMLTRFSDAYIQH